jgi:hypothetical protein
MRSSFPPSHPIGSILKRQSQESLFSISPFSRLYIKEILSGGPNIICIPPEALARLSGSTKIMQLLMAHNQGAFIRGERTVVSTWGKCSRVAN